MAFKNIDITLPSTLPTFTAILEKGGEVTSVCIGVYVKDDGDFVFDKVWYLVFY